MSDSAGYTTQMNDPYDAAKRAKASDLQAQLSALTAELAAAEERADITARRRTQLEAILRRTEAEVRAAEAKWQAAHVAADNALDKLAAAEAERDQWHDGWTRMESMYSVCQSELAKATAALERIVSATGGLYTGPDNRNDPILLRVARIARQALQEQSDGV